MMEDVFAVFAEEHDCAEQSICFALELVRMCKESGDLRRNIRVLGLKRTCY